MISIFLVVYALVVCKEFENPLARYRQPENFLECPMTEPTFRVPDLRNVCIERCENDLFDCIIDCNNDVQCVSDCIRIQTECISSCPCEFLCLDGCSGCDNPVCQCEVKESNDDWNSCFDANSLQLGRCVYACNGERNCEADCNDDFRQRQLDFPCEENCIGGCPCVSDACTETTTSPDVTTPSQPETTTSPTSTAVLILSTANSARPMIVDFDGNINDDLAFEFGEGATVMNGCGATLNGEFWYFGNGKKVSKIDGCQLVRQPDMPFDLSYPSCNTFVEPTPKILLCFDDSNAKDCHTFDGEYYNSVESTKYRHDYTYGLGNHKDQALAVGCYSSNSDCSFKAELLDMNTLEWSDGPDYPFGSNQISEYSTAQSPDAAYIIGGRYTKNLVAEFKNDQWRQLDDLKQGRYCHGSITVGTQTMVVGGVGTFETEVWELENGNYKIIKPTVASQYYGLGLFAVDFNFCSQ